MSKFRTAFGEKFSKSILLWFPGHMGKGLKQMQQQMKNVDCVVEVHDARIPLSGRNELFRNQILGLRPHILVLNKCDLIDPGMQKTITNALRDNNIANEVLFTDCRTPQGAGVSDVVPKIKEVMTNVHRYNRQLEQSFNILVIGVPNVGKSSLINVLRNYHLKKKKAAHVGAIAGITRSVMNKIHVCYDPSIYILDSPGILEPQVRDVDAGFRLALCASMQDHLVGIINIADYLLYWFNKNKYNCYVEKLGLPEPCDDIVELLTLYALKNKLFIKFKDVATGKVVERPNIEHAAQVMVKMFRQGEFGRFILDSDLLPAPKQTT